MILLTLALGQGETKGKSHVIRTATARRFQTMAQLPARVMAADLVETFCVGCTQGRQAGLQISKLTHHHGAIK